MMAKKIRFVVLLGICAIGICACSRQVSESDTTENLAVIETENHGESTDHLMLVETESIKNTDFFEVSFQEKDIEIAQSDTGEVVNRIAIPNDTNQLFLHMVDETNGFLLYCSTPGAGQMEKILYKTEDGWKNYEEMDISTRIDGYPTSLSCSPDEQLYVGAQMRSDGYLFVSEDEGKHWNPVLIDEDVETCRYGYAPVFNEEKSQAYILLECDGSYALYLSEDALSTWKKIGTFSLEDEDSVEQYFLSEDQIYIHTSQDKTYLLEGATKE